MRRFRVTAGIQPLKYPHLHALAWAIYNAFVLNIALLPGCPLAMPAFLALITAFDLAQAATSSKSPLAYTTRNAKAALLVAGLRTLETFVQGLCDASPELAAQLCSAAGMHPMGSSAHSKPAIKVTPAAGVSGAIDVDVNVAQLVGQSSARPTFHWQTSSNGGATWQDSLSTARGDTTISGLPLGVVILTRVCVTLKKVTGAWVQHPGITLH